VAQIQIDIPYEQITEFCRKWKIAEFALFGSVLREDFRPDSDVDVLVRFIPNPGWSLLDRAHMQRELSEIFHRKVDLVNRLGIERSRNPYRKKAILNSAQVVLDVA